MNRYTLPANNLDDKKKENKKNKKKIMLVELSIFVNSLLYFVSYFCTAVYMKYGKSVIALKNRHSNSF